MNLRSHQRDAIRLAADPGFGKDFRMVLAAVTPGGGKSALPVILGLRALALGIADRICWVVPRDSLKKQAAEAFLDKRFRGLLGHNIEIREADNETDPSRGSNGYSTTYQAVGADPDLHRAEFFKYRYVLILDELHHVAEKSIWHQALGPMVERAAMVIAMSGTLSRDDDRRIAFINYTDMGGGEHEVQLDSDRSYRVLRYTRKQALAEEAILPIFFERIDGQARWIDRKGVEREVSSLVGAGLNGSQAVYSLLRSDYAEALITAMVTHWRGYLKDNPRSKFLVIAPNIALAREYLRIVRSLGIQAVDKATSDDGEGLLNIDRLKGRSRKGTALQGLVTVGMAYEGLDCPEISHIACLTQVRSTEWLEQMLARATRVDYGSGPYEEQAAYVWAPDDDMFSKAVKRIREEQAPTLVEKDKKTRAAAELQADDGPAFIVLEGESTSARAQNLQTGEVVHHHDLETLKRVQSDTGLFNVNLFELKKVVASESAAGAKSNLTLKEQERQVRKKLHVLTTRLAGGDPEKIIALNRSVLRKFGVPRANMAIGQLNDALEFLQQGKA